MRRWILDLHLYLGLVLAPYLVLYGVSAIAFNHHLKTDPESDTFERMLVEAPARQQGDDLATAEALRDDLSLIGFVPKQSVRTEESALAFRVRRPGADYDVAWDEQTRTATIQRKRLGILNVLQGVHGMRLLEGSTLSWPWYVYTELSSWALVFAAIGGFYLWAPSRGTAAGWGMAVGGALAFSLLAAWVW